jgi:hypothetical protein
MANPTALSRFRSTPKEKSIMKLFQGKKWIAVGTMTGALAAGVAAYAAVSGTWLSPQGSGSGNATGYTAIKADITSATTNDNLTGTASLYPNSSVTNTVTVTNPNPYAIIVTSIGAGSSDALTGCAAGNVTSAALSNATGLTQDPTGTSIVPGGTGVYDVTYTMSSTAPTTCQGKAFALTLTVGSASANF